MITRTSLLCKVWSSMEIWFSYNVYPNCRFWTLQEMCYFLVHHFLSFVLTFSDAFLQYIYTFLDKALALPVLLQIICLCGFTSISPREALVQCLVVCPRYATLKLDTRVCALHCHLPVFPGAHLDERGLLRSSIHEHYPIDIANPHSMQDAYHMNFVRDFTHHGVSVAQS